MIEPVLSQGSEASKDLSLCCESERQTDEGNRSEQWIFITGKVTHGISELFLQCLLEYLCALCAHLILPVHDNIVALPPGFVN